MSCRQTYAAVNALAGHYNSFGPTAPLPKKRLERLRKVRMRQPCLAHANPADLPELCCSLHP